MTAPRAVARRGALLAVLLTCGFALAAGAAPAEPTAPAAPPYAADYRLPAGPLEFGPRETARCLDCHGLPSFVARDSLHPAARLLTVAPNEYAASTHGALACTQCHGDVRRYPHELGASRPRIGCDADCHAVDASGRPVRHTAASAEFARSVHGEPGASPNSPTCTSCHGGGDPHAVRPVRESTTRAARLAQCASCHSDRERMLEAGVTPDAVASYEESFHFKALRMRSTRAAVCIDCHTAHGVRAPTDSLSTVHPRQLPRTCGQDGCHKGVQLSFAMSGANHLSLRVARDPVLALVESLFFWLGAVVLLVLGAGVALDAQRRIGRPAQAVSSLDRTLVDRLTLAQRAQHWALMVSFVALVLSGLPLRFNDVHAFRALGFALGGLPILHAIHRAAGVLLIATGLAHAGYALILLVRARFDVRAAWPMLPTRKDARDWWELSLYFLRLRPQPPQSERHEFRQKLHYFVVLAGLPIMAITGVLLWFPVFFGNRLPDAAFGIAYLVHSQQAMAALLVLLVWHLYQVYAQPGAHGRFLTWVDGRITRGQWREQHGAEAARVGEPPAVSAPVAGDVWARATPWLLAIIMVVATLLRLREATRTPLWFDELFSLWMARHPLPETMALLPGDIHPPLPTLLLSLWLAVGGDSPLWLKSLPLLLGLLAVLATYGFTRALFGRPVALLAAALLALHPSHVYFSQELRGYGLLTLVLLLAAWSAWHWTVTGRGRFAMLWAASAALAMHTHYLGAVVLALLSLYALVVVRHSPQQLRAWLLAHLAMAVLMAPLLGLLPGQLRLSRDTWVAQPAPADLMDLARKVAFGAIYLVPVLMGAAVLSLARASSRRSAAFAWWMAIGAILLTFALSLRGPHLFAARYMYFSLPYWCALFAAGLCALPWPRLRALVIVLVLLLGARAAMLRAPLAEAVDVQRAITLMRSLAQPGDLVFTADPHTLLCLDQVEALPTARLLSDESRLAYYRGGALFGPDRIAPLDSLRSLQPGRRWWAIHTPEPGRPGARAVALLDSLAPAGRRPVGIVTLWVGEPRMLMQQGVGSR